MHLLLNQQLAQQHQADVKRKAELAQFANQVRAAESTPRHLHALHFLKHWYDRMSLLSYRPVVRREPPSESVSLTEIRPALLITFCTLHERGFVSDYDEQFIEEFADTFQEELVHRVESVARA